MKKFYTLIFCMLCSYLLFAQSIVSVTPSSGNAGQILGVTITGQGTHFAQNSYTTVFNGFDQCSGTVLSTVVNSNTSITATIAVPSYTINGKYDFNVYNITDGYLAIDNYFQINSSFPNAVLTPNYGLPGQTVTVNIQASGAFFTQSSGTVSADFTQRICNGVDFSSTSTTVYNDSVMDAYVTIPAGTDTGYYDLIIGGISIGTIYPNVFHVGLLSNIVSYDSDFSLNVFESDKNNIVLKINAPQICEPRIQIFDAYANKPLDISAGKIYPGENKITINKTKALSRQGIYFVSILVDNKRYVKKIVLLN